MKKLVILLIVLLFIVNLNYISAEDNSTSNNDISLKLDWNEDDIINGKEFDVKIEADNLLDNNYDIKVFIFSEDKNKPISQVYYNDKWQSSTNYMNEFIIGPGDIIDTVTLRIKDINRYFKGEATIGIRIREHGKTSYLADEEDSIDILEGEEASSTSDDVEDSINVESVDKDNNENVIEAPISSDVIYLGSSNVKSESIKSKKNIVYESNNELIKKFSIYSFILLLVIFLGVLAFVKSKNKI